MGMHFGVLAARCRWPDFQRVILEPFGSVEDRGVVSEIESVDWGPDSGDGFHVAGGELDDTSILLDTSMLLSGAGFDQLLEASRALDCVVASCVGETVSGSFGFFAADRGQLRRLYSSCASGITHPFSKGAALMIESREPLEDIDGAGLLGAMEELGFQYARWFETAPKRHLYFTPNDLFEREPLHGGLSAELADHWKRFAIPPDQRPAPQVVTRVLADGSTGFDIVSGREKPGPIRSFINRIFGK